MSFISEIFSPVKRYKNTVIEINNFEDNFSKLSPEEIKKESQDLREKIKKEEINLEEAMPKAFALVRESAKRNLNQRHFDVQLIGGMVLFEGKIAEMTTGEGKTLAATAPAYLRALTGKGVHIITVNDYLAQRDAVWMGQIYNFLGLTTSCIIHDQAFIYDPGYTNEKIDEENKNSISLNQSDNKGGSILLDKERDTTGSFRVQKEFLRTVSRREAYKADIVYGTNHEFGFDYLRDNLAYSLDTQVQNGHYFAIIDEVDSILIDEARTPLIISAPDVQAADFYKLFAGVVQTIKPEEDYIVDEKNKSVQIIDSGIEKVEKMLNLENIYDPQNARLVHYLEESLKAKALFKRDKQYVVKNGEIIIVDEFTGRMMHGRRYSGGLHQAIEAKENVRVQEESKTFAQITIQNYFRLYEKISGMTGTAQTSAEEFNKVYGLEVITVPTNKPKIREDLSDLIYKTKESKYHAIVKEVKERSQKGQPLLVGTTSIDENEILSGYFSNSGIKHEVLNAKNHEREGEIIAQAGKPGSVTLATNMAGRGVDIILGGNPPEVLESQKVKEEGGLFVLGTQRNEARRIDNQLRGRSGRQGDPGESQFYLSLEDDLLRVFGGDRIKSMMTRFDMPEDVPIESSLVGRVVNEAQKKVEGINFDIRKHLLEYDDVLNKQRKAVYRRRQNLLEDISLGKTEEVLKQITKTSLVNVLNSIPEDDSKISNFNKWLEATHILDKDQILTVEDLEKIKLGELPESIGNKIKESSKDFQTGMKVLGALDGFWTNHLENLEALLESVRIRAYGQKDPLVEYKRESYQMFRDLVANAEIWVISNVFIPREAKQQTIVQQNQNGHDKIGRNDPCWCGSGKKYKHCHGK